MDGSSEKSRKASWSSLVSSAFHSMRFPVLDLEEGSSKRSNQFVTFSSLDASATGGFDVAGLVFER